MKALLVALLISQTTTSTNTVDRKLFDAVAIEAVEAQRIAKDARVELRTCRETALIVKNGNEMRAGLKEIEEGVEDVKEIRELEGSGDDTGLLLGLAIGGIAGVAIGAIAAALIISSGGGGVTIVGGTP